MRVGYRNWFGSVDYQAAVANLSELQVNYRSDEVREAGWHHDTYCTRLPAEVPGDPEPNGSWKLAQRLVQTYEPPVPSIIQGLYRPDRPLLGRDLLLEARFYGLHFEMGVRITEVIDEVRDDRVVWGWSYQTLQGHLERGRMSYEVAKDRRTGEVEFAIRAVSQLAPTVGPLLRLGWRLFGRRMQLRFYRGCGERVSRLVTEVLAGRAGLPSPRVVDGLARAPSDAERAGRDRVALRSRHPG